MAELSIPYVRRQLARSSPGGRGGGTGGAVAQPRVPDVSGVYAAQRGVGQEMEESASVLANVAARQRRARDVATLTEFETGISEAVGVAAVDITRDETIHPDDYYGKLAAYRDQLFTEKSKSLPGHLQAAGKAKAYNGTERTLIATKELGAKKALERYTNSYDLFMEQQSRDFLNAPDQQTRDNIGQRMRDKTLEYVEGGIFSSDQAALKLRKIRDNTEFEALSLYAMDNPKAFLAQAKQGAMADLPGEMRIKLIDKAESQRREQAEWQDAEDRRAEKAVSIQQNENESRYRERIYQMGGGPGALRLISEARSNREIGPDQHDRLMGFAINLQTQRENQAAARAARGAAAAQRAEIAQRRADENQAGMLTAKMLAGTPDAHGQAVTAEAIIGLAASGKINGTVAGRVASQADSYRRIIDNEGDSAKKQAYTMGLDNAKNMFDMHSARPDRASVIDQAWSGFFTRYQEAVWKEGMEPNEAIAQFAPQYIAQAESLVAARTTVLNGAMPEAYRAPVEQGFAGLEAAKKQLKDDFEAQLLSQSDYRTYARQLKEFEVYAPYRKPAAKPAAPVPGTPAAPQQESAMERIRKQATGALGFPKSGEGGRR